MKAWTDRPQERGRDDGFSLLETLVVLMLLSIVAAVSVTFVVRRDAARDPHAVAAQIADIFTRARIAAIARARQEFVTLDVGLREVRFPGDDVAVALPPGIGMTVLIGREMMATERSATLVFFADGGSTGTELTLDDGRRRAVVRVPWLTGVPSLGRLP